MSCVLVSTSAGPLHVEYQELPSIAGGLELSLSSFDDHGWRSRPKSWQAANDEGLAQVIAAAASIPGPEAEEVATRLLGPVKEEWMTRGGPEADARAEWIMWGVWLGFAVWFVFGVWGIVVTAAWLT